MTAPWSGTSAPAASSTATFTIAPPSSGPVTGFVPRLRGLSASVAGSTITSSTLQVSDGSTVLLSLDMGTAAGQPGFSLVLPDLDYRASISNSLVIGFATGVSNCTQKVNAFGDFVQIGVETLITATK